MDLVGVTFLIVIIASIVLIRRIIRRNDDKIISLQLPIYHDRDKYVKKSDLPRDEARVSFFIEETFQTPLTPFIKKIIREGLKFDKNISNKYQLIAINVLISVGVKSKKDYYNIRNSMSSLVEAHLLDEYSKLDACKKLEQQLFEKNIYL